MDTMIPFLLKVEYSCYCGIEKQAVGVPFRLPDEDVKVYLEQKVMPVVAEDHHRRRPECRSQRLKTLAIPLNKSGEVRVGEPIKDDHEQA